MIYFEEVGIAPSICANCDSLKFTQRSNKPRCQISGKPLARINSSCNYFEPNTNLLRADSKTRLCSHQPQIDKALALGYPEKYLNLLNVLQTPQDVQVWLGENLKYQHNPEMLSVYNGFSETIESGQADCFRAMLLSFTWLYFRNYHPQIMLFQAGSNKLSEDHNVVTWKKKEPGQRSKFGCVGFSSWSTLAYRPANYRSYFDLAASFVDEYTSDRKGCSDLRNLRGFAIIDPIKQFGKKRFFEMIFASGGQADELLREFYKEYTKGIWCTDLKTKGKYPYPD